MTIQIVEILQRFRLFAHLWHYHTYYCLFRRKALSCLVHSKALQKDNIVRQNKVKLRIAQNISVTHVYGHVQK